MQSSSNPFRNPIQLDQASYPLTTPPHNPQAQDYPSDSKNNFLEDNPAATHSNPDAYANYQQQSPRALPPVNQDLENNTPPPYSYEAPPGPPPTQASSYLPQQPPSRSQMPPYPIVDRRSPGPIAGPSSSSSASGFASRLNPRDPLNPPPMSFSRPLPSHLHPGPPGTIVAAFTPFPPMRLFSNGETLDNGFPILVPACSVPVHPFSQRDVHEGDWTRFLEDLQIRGRLTGGERIASNVLPLAMSVGFIGGLFVTRGIEKHMKHKKDGPVSELVDIWNEHFFHIRRMHVILAHGSENVSGDVDGPAPDYYGQRSRSGSSSSSSSSDDERGQHNRHNRHNIKQERRQRRRERRQDRRERKNDKRQSRHEKYRLVVISI